MPLVAHNELPTFARLRDEGQRVLAPERAVHQDVRPLHVGLLNMMPDAALAATERQFFRLIGSSNPISQFYVHPFSLDSLPRADYARAHIDAYYESFDDIRNKGLDALIISGANITQPRLSDEIFWEPLAEVMAWADDNVTSTLCSCLATHAVMLARHGLERQSLSQKCWGVFDHQAVRADHPLVAGLNTHMSVPHSRFNVISRERMESAGLHVLVESERVGVQVAVSPDGFRTVFMQGHPEYDSISLMKEYKREVGRFLNGYLSTYPPVPDGYFDAWSLALLDEYRGHVEQAVAEDLKPPRFPEHLLVPRLQNTWHDSGEALVGNWLGLVYQLTHADRALPFMDGVARDNPLNWSPLPSA